MPNHGAGREAVNEAVHEAGYECIVSLLSTVVCTIGGSTTHEADYGARKNIERAHD